jgi:thiamine-phosphate pyrophosphorylase
MERKAPDPATAGPRLMLVTPVIADAGPFAPMLAAACGTADIAAVIARLAETDERTLINRVKQLAPAVQEKGAALILDGHAEIVAGAGADGTHVSGGDAFSQALSLLKPDRIVGAGELRTRHEAMVAAEQGADYVMFGEPDTQGHRPSFAAIVERVTWWAEIFEIPCVAFAARLEEVAELADVGADFIALADSIWSVPHRLGDAAAHLKAPERVA